MLQHILVGLDGSSLAESILPYVTTLASRLSAEVSLLSVVQAPEGGRASLGQLIQGSQTRAEVYLQGIQGRLQAAGLSARSEVQVGEPAPEIVAAAQRGQADLIALATHGRSGLQRWMHGSVAEAVLQIAETPLLLIRPREGQGTPSAVDQVLVPLDGSARSEAVLPYAERLASAFGIPLALLQAVQSVLAFAEPGDMGAAYADTLDALQANAADNVQRHAAGLRSKGVEVVTLTPTGSPAAEITGYVQEHPGTLVVMSTQGRTGLAGMVLGSVARRVVQQVDGPVLLVRLA